MKKQLIFFSSLIIIPVLVISTLYSSLLKYEKKIETNTYEKDLSSNITIKINKNNNIEEINLEEYVLGVVAGEMPASFNIEALKAQAVASRTYAIYKLNNSSNIETTTDDQVYISISEMKEKWGELTLPFHTCSGWYDSVEWTIIHVDEAILELKSIDTQDIEDVERQILQELIEMFEYAYKHKARLTISCA